MDITFKIKTRCWFDKASKSYIVYSKDYDITGYGKTKKKAAEMFLVCLREALLYSQKYC